MKNLFGRSHPNRRVYQGFTLGLAGKVRHRVGCFLAALSMTLWAAAGCFQMAPQGDNPISETPRTSNPAVVAVGSSQPAPPAQVALGTNLAGIFDWSSQLPFLDGFKSSRPWVTQCDEGEPGCRGTWSTDEADQLDLDEHGWVKSLPAPEDPPEFTKVGTLMFHGIHGRYPGGAYVVLYEGEGTIEYAFDARKDEAASRPGRDVIQVTPSDGGIYLRITATDPQDNGNYLRNLHVVPLASEKTFQTEIFNPLFLERTRPFQALRFMDWMQTNNSEQGEWANRPEVEDATYAEKGVPLEIMVALANRLQAHAWFNMPHQATDEYITQFAQQVKATLDPQLKVYVELSNEAWNWQFGQSHYTLEQGQARWGKDEGDAFAQWYGMRAAQMSDIWNQVFADQRDRLVTILATQTGYRGLEKSILDCPLWVQEGNQPCYQHGIDAYAITGYFGGQLGRPEMADQINGWFREPDGGFDKALAYLDSQSGGNGETINPGSVQETTDYFAYHARIARERGLTLVAYEGGQHIVGREGREHDETLTNFLIELNRQPEMYDLYTTLLNAWDAAGGDLFMHFSDIVEPNKWGSWGALEYVGQETSPKYKALMDFLQSKSVSE